MKKTLTFPSSKTSHIPPTCNSVGSVFRFHGIGRRGVSAGFDGTKSTATRASVPKKHDCRGRNTISASVPTLSDVGALRLLADGVQAEPRERLLHLLVPLSLRRSLPKPPGLLHARVSPRVGADLLRSRWIRRCMWRPRVDLGWIHGFTTNSTVETETSSSVMEGFRKWDWDWTRLRKRLLKHFSHFRSERLIACLRVCERLWSSMLLVRDRGEWPLGLWFLRLDFKVQSQVTAVFVGW